MVQNHEGSKGQAQAKTRGWMISELERHGVNIRGKKASDAELMSMLERLGYTIGKEVKKAKRKKERRDTAGAFCGGKRT